MRKGLLPTLAFAAVPLLIGAGLAWVLKPSLAPVYRNVEVPVEVIREVERVDTIVSWRERAVYVEKEPETVATAPEGAVGLVQSFCGDSLTLAGGDPISPVRPTLLLRSVRTDPGWFFAPDRVTLTGPLSNGDLRQLRYEARPGWQAHVQGEAAVFQSPRWWWVREGVEAAAFLGLGYLVGAL